MEKLLAHRKTLKAKKPTFMRQDAHKKGRLKNNWRKPKGSDSKMRVHRRGYRQSVKIGWGSPKAIKYMVDGLMPVLVDNISQLQGLDPKAQIIIIKSSVGLKKKLLILAEAGKKDLKVSGIKDINAYVDAENKRLEEKRKVGKDKKASRSEKKEKVKKEAEKKAKEEKAKEEKAKGEKEKAEKVSPESEVEAKKQEKKEKDKLLTSKQPGK